eukprot:Blabericola_migrator_1__4680@NODE_2473_length_2710_cov_32_560726_g1550_i0_p4_GENE_NODE_2473_length_2710_cov_32_560726_g1550_i0NODE_2473_length_2710_cov_32_560726_g1550_i0_p4_ORF_typecomplete_len108_score6_17_NODE_2473_length_2710_cov_32_560726_g1550_i0615938
MHSRELQSSPQQERFEESESSRCRYVKNTMVYVTSANGHWKVWQQVALRHRGGLTEHFLSPNILPDSHLRVAMFSTNTLFVVLHAPGLRTTAVAIDLTYPGVEPIFT